MSPSFRPKAVVFDLDGTLVDSLPLVLRAIGHALEPFGPRPTKEIFARLGGPPARFLATLLDDVRNVPTALRRMDEYHRENAHLIRPFAGVDRLLGRLQSNNVHLGLWTGRDRESTDELLRTHQLERFFDAVMCGDDLPSHKPDPAGLREIIRRLDVRPDETLFVGDADVDVLGGVAAGVGTVLIEHDRVVDPEIRAQSWQTVDSPEAAFAMLLQWVVAQPTGARPPVHKH